MYQEKIYKYLQSNDFICDDCLSEVLSIRPRSQVNYLCNGLYRKKRIHRRRDVCSVCGKYKFINIMKDENKFRVHFTSDQFNGFYHTIWNYSKYYGELYSTSFRLYEEESGQGALLILFNLTEILLKDKLNNYVISYNDACGRFLKKGAINDLEYEFLNNKSYGIRGMRNIMTHANLMKFNLVFPDDNPELMYPMTEDYNSVILFEKLAPKLSEILTKIICFVESNLDLAEADEESSPDTVMDEECKILDSKEQDLTFPNIIFRELSIEQLIASRGLDVAKTLEAFADVPKSKQYSMIENLAPTMLKMSIIDSFEKESHTYIEDFKKSSEKNK